MEAKTAHKSVRLDATKSRLVSVSGLSTNLLAITSADALSSNLRVLSPKFPLESFPDAFCLDLFQKPLTMVGM